MPFPACPAATTASLALALVAFGTAAPAAATPYRLDLTHTTVHWEVVHRDTSTARGRFDTLAGRTAFEPGRRLEVEIRVDPASVSTGIRPFDTVLRGASLLAVREHPQAAFVSRRIDWAADGLSPSAVHGEITLKGRTQPLTLTAQRWRCGNNPLFGREVCGGDFSATLSRGAFGMGFASSMADDAVRLLVQVEAIRLEPGEDEGMPMPVPTAANSGSSR